jgi:reverse gyrase
MSKLPPHMIRRMIFMFCIMFPVLIYAEYIGRNSVMLAAVTAGLTSGVSVVLFPDPEHLKNLKNDKNKEQ